jgi:DNA mismatch endonuclease (patch repair protein)
MKKLDYEPPTDRARSELMRRVRQKGTKPEDQVASVLRRLKVGFRRNVRTLPGSPDFANKSRKWAIFVNGCFWHRHKGCVRATTPKRNRQFWLAKFAANVVRDAQKARALRIAGYKVFVVWECQASDEARLRRRFESLAD